MRMWQLTITNVPILKKWCNWQFANYWRSGRIWRTRGTIW